MHRDRELCSVLRSYWIEGHRESVSVCTLVGYSYDHAARKADLEVSGMYGQEGFIGTAIGTEQWPHLSCLSLPQARADQVALIIGQDNSEALAPLSTIFGRRGEPYAIRTCLGWSLHGVLGVATTWWDNSHACLVACRQWQQQPSSTANSQEVKQRHSGDWCTKDPPTDTTLHSP